MKAKPPKRKSLQLFILYQINRLLTTSSSLNKEITEIKILIIAFVSVLFHFDSLNGFTSTISESALNVVLSFSFCFLPFRNVLLDPYLHFTSTFCSFFE